MHETVSATTTIHASSQAVFAVLADPALHAGIDGTGRVRASLDGRRITRAGPVFRVEMFHENHPDGSYEMCNEVLAFDAPYEISWRPGYVGPTGELEFGGWVWGYELSEIGPMETVVTHRYDWSAVGPGPRQHLSFPPFPADHLDTSLRNLAEFVESRIGVLAG